MFKLDKLPFFYKSHSTPGNGGFPHVLPFDLYYDETLTMFRQKPTDQLVNILDEVYKKGSLAEGSISSESGDIYRDKVIDYIFLRFPFHESSKVLEVGFGSGVLLKKLKAGGVKNLTGVEPGNHNQVDGLENIRLINDYFPTNHLNERFDLIYAMLVLEHVLNPVEYLNQLIGSLNKDGKIIFAVPNCEPYLNEGDISIFIHEHFSYFTRSAITKLVEQTDFNVEDISIIEGAFIVTICKSATLLKVNKEIFLADKFYSKIKIHVNKLNSLFEQYSQSSLAIYAPIRAINMLFLTGNTSYRLVDDNSEMQGHYLPALASPIESFEEMASRPPECILIFSRTFGERVKAKCLLDIRFKNTNVITLSDLDKIK